MKKLSESDRKNIAAVSASIFIGNRSDANTLRIYVDILSRLNIDDFAYAITCLYEIYEKKKIPFHKEEKIKFVIAVLTILKDIEGIDFDEYKRRLLHAISGAYKGDKYLVRDNGYHMPLYGWDS
ncbi:putative exported protein [Pectobacterium atrosepticum SCRI1043]|uniref:Exported protein n=1 Tax=Pectobacterium atrosepticum (strain SCRI 1043 / ATCC BAA-672) TaxID=218491 RepID=Q6D6N3_PECAS|nr:hypothetical protein [Pectobacterium atrosepticum]MCL6316317.1 hypothetical protein [Pectobacterium atrosepticum]MCL6319447.1 hypothetical protein [Pectobacterium atrosepticum]CAG74553.1 putative exported protein [Pectobacterium atrosepticum SCRI1043]